MNARRGLKKLRCVLFFPPQSCPSPLIVCAFFQGLLHFVQNDGEIFRPKINSTHSRIPIQRVPAYAILFFSSQSRRLNSASKTKSTLSGIFIQRVPAPVFLFYNLLKFYYPKRLTIYDSSAIIHLNI